MRLLLVAILVALLPGSAARAERKVDWSQYLEKPGDRMAKRSTPVVAEQKKAKQAKKAKKAPRRAAKKALKAKRKRGRRR